MGAPAEIKDLIERFPEQKHDLNEAQVRQTFIDPLFGALGWDVSSKKQRGQVHREVVLEDSLRVEGAMKAPDYGFYLGPSRKFFVEAKAPAVNIDTRIESALQLRRYGWSAGLPLSILTDFEEFAVYDCRIRPEEGDNARTARTTYLTFDKYEEKWHEIADVFSKEAVRDGSLDALMVPSKKRGSLPVDKAFLSQIESWREVLAKNIHQLNPSLNRWDLNYAVQVTIDRIVFLRVCEDRGVEEYGKLERLLEGSGVYDRLCNLFRDADGRYNSGLFHFSQDEERGFPDDLTPELGIEDEVLKEMIQGLYYPKSPYQFSVMPVEILGQTYEQFLGKVIRIEDSGEVSVKEKPEVRKAGGVYYTPTYIVDYIVENTVGRLIEGKTPKQVSNLKIADPACGSGSFLIGAYEYLLEWHLKWYVDNDPKKHPKAIFEYEYPTEEGTATEWRLRIGEKKSILTNNIYGVDIDDQAVEVTKLSLLLKVLEGETSDSMESQLSLLDERVLPYLGKNIQSGNSLIGHDFYETGQLGLLDEEEERRINTFSWESAFPEVFSRKKPGFDTVIGNPPYVLLQDEFRDDNQLAYFRSKFSVASYKIDTYHLFVERSVDLARSSGRCAMITPANFIANNYLASLRRFLLEESVIDHVMVIDGGVFDGISVDNAIFVLEASEQPTESFDLVHAYPDASRLHKKSQITISGSQSLQRQHVLFTGTSEKVTNALWDRILSQSCNLGSIANVNFGKQLRNRKQFTEDVIAVSRIEDIAEPYRPCYTGRDVSRYSLSWNGLACLNDEVARSGGCWDEDKQNAKNKILTRQIGEYPSFGIDRSGYQCLNTMFMIGVRDTDVDPAFVLGVLNSKVTKVYWLDRFYDQRRTFPKIKGTYLKELPIRTIDFSDTEDSARHEKMVTLVEQMMELKKQLVEEKVPQNKNRLQQRIDWTDKEIDKLVYEMYGLTDEEIGIVEGTLAEI